MRNAPDFVACVVGLGGNVGDVATTLRAAFDALDALPSTRLVRASGLYRTPAWGVTAQADFLNAAALLETALPAHALLDELLAIERTFAVSPSRWSSPSQLRPPSLAARTASAAFGPTTTRRLSGSSRTT